MYSYYSSLLIFLTKAFFNYFLSIYKSINDQRFKMEEKLLFANINNTKEFRKKKVTLRSMMKKTFFFLQYDEKDFNLIFKV
jgi:hypothetical protein